MIKLFRGKLQIHVLMLPTIILLLSIYGAREVLGFICAAMVHECAHAAMASALGVYVNRIEILPYGCAAVIERIDYVQAAAVFMIAAAGPAANIVSYSIVNHSINGVFAQSFLKGCIGLCAVNMLPCAKTDGGRMFIAILSKYFREESVYIVVQVISIFIGLGMIVIFIYFAVMGDINISLAVFGAFILLSAYDMSRTSKKVKRSKLLLRRKILRTGSAYAVHHVLKENSTVGDALSIMEVNKYNIFYIVDGDMKLKRSADEGEVIAKAIKEGRSARLGIR